MIPPYFSDEGTEAKYLVPEHTATGSLSWVSVINDHDKPVSQEYKPQKRQSPEGRNSLIQPFSAYGLTPVMHHTGTLLVIKYGTNYAAFINKYTIF